MSAKQRREDAHDRDLSLAWHTAALSKQDKLPSLESLLKRRQMATQAPMDPRDMLHQLSARLGIPIQQVRLIRKDAA